MGEHLSMLDSIGKLERRPRVDPLRFLTVSPYLPMVHRPRKLSRWERLRCWLEDLVDGAELAREVYPWRRVLRTELAPAPYAYFLGDRLLVHPAHAAMVRTVYA